MTRIDFFQLDTDEAPLMFTCRLIAKAYRAGNQIYVHTTSSEQCDELDELLWSFQEDQFIPHAVQGETGKSPIKIGYDHEPVDHQDVLINLSGEVPDFFSRFERVAEVVPSNESSRDSARNNYRFYKERGYDLRYHKIQKPRT